VAGAGAGGRRQLGSARAGRLHAGCRRGGDRRPDPGDAPLRTRWRDLRRLHRRIFIARRQCGRRRGLRRHRPYDWRTGPGQACRRIAARALSHTPRTTRNVAGPTASPQSPHDVRPGVVCRGSRRRAGVESRLGHALRSWPLVLRASLLCRTRVRRRPRQISGPGRCGAHHHRDWRPSRSTRTRRVLRPASAEATAVPRSPGERGGRKPPDDKFTGSQLSAVSYHRTELRGLQT
jgi:hypothetical protein